MIIIIVLYIMRDHAHIPAPCLNNRNPARVILNKVGKLQGPRILPFF